MATERYLPVEMPERFALEFQDDDGDWIVEAVCPADYFERLESPPPKRAFA